MYSEGVLCVKPVSGQQEMPHVSGGFVGADAVGVIKMNLNESCKSYSRMKPGGRILRVSSYTVYKHIYINKTHFKVTHNTL